VFLLFWHKKIFNKLFRAKTQIAVNVPRLGEELAFEIPQPKPKLNNVPMLMLLLWAKFLQFSRNRSKIAKQKLIILPSAGFLPNRLLNAFCVFAFLGQKTL